MSSADDQQSDEAAGINPDDVDWAAFFEEYGFDSENGVAANKLETMLEVGDRVSGVNYELLVKSALDEGYLARADSGIGLPGGYTPRQEPEPEPDVEEEPEQDASPDTKDDEDIEEDDTVEEEVGSKKPRGELEQDVDELREIVEEQQETITKLEALVNGLQSKVQRQNELLVGGSGLEEYDTESLTDHHTRLAEQEDRLQELEEQSAMLPSASEGRTKPDSRAAAIRNALAKRAKGQGDDKAAMTRKEVDALLGADNHRATLLDAMRRAADGSEADVDGACNLPPVDAITFEKGSPNGGQSKIRIDVSNLTGKEARKILTTSDTEEGGR